MTFRLLWFLLKLGLIGLIVALLLQLSGTIRIDVIGWRLEIPLAVGIVTVCVTLLFIIKVEHLRLAILRLPEKWRQNRALKQQKNGLNALTQGLLAAAAGDSITTHKQAELAKSLLGDQPAIQLLQAQSAQISGDFNAAQQFFEQLSQSPETRISGLLGLYRLAESRMETDIDAKQQALDLAKEIAKLEPDHPVVAPNLNQLAIACEDWEMAEKSLLRLQKTQGKSKERSRQLAEIYYKQALDARKGQDMDKALNLAKQAIKINPADEAATLLAVRLLQDRREIRPAIRLIQDLWRITPSEAAGKLYLELNPDQSKTAKQLEHIHRLIELNPEHRESKLLLAETAIDCSMWGKARLLLEAMHQENESNPNDKRLYQTLAKLELLEHNDQQRANQWLMSLS